MNPKNPKYMNPKKLQLFFSSDYTVAEILCGDVSFSLDEKSRKVNSPRLRKS